MFDFFGNRINKLKESLAKTRDNLSKRIQNLVTFHRELDEQFYESLEEILITSDIGVNTTQNIIEKLKKEVRTRGIKNSEDCRTLLKEIILDTLNMNQNIFQIQSPAIITLVGVNGVGKTTTIAKLA